MTTYLKYSNPGQKCLYYRRFTLVFNCQSTTNPKQSKGATGTLTLKIQKNSEFVLLRNLKSLVDYMPTPVELDEKELSEDLHPIRIDEETELAEIKANVLLYRKNPASLQIGTDSYTYTTETSSSTKANINYNIAEEFHDSKSNLLDESFTSDHKIP
ncbi:hypothetical protein GJ496_002702 [Pomphorhynchus laevis]|nr:hypothetical protein GJ496_002702 [Pomphorhynchus laevis]